MRRFLRFSLAMLAFVALASSGSLAQSGAGQKPPDAKPAATADTQKPADVTPELPADAKAFNAAAGEKNPLKRVELLEKFIADNPKAAPSLVSMAKSQIPASLLMAFKDSRTKYLATVDTEVETAKGRADTQPIYTTYNSLASRLATAGIYSEEAEDFARKGLAGMDERTYMDLRKKAYDRQLASYEKAAAAWKDGKPPAAPAPPATPAPPAAPPAPAGPTYRFAQKDGVIQASIAPPPTTPATPRAAPTPRPPTKPTAPTDDELRTALKMERASAQATLGQILMKRGKTDEGTRVLLEAYAAKPATSTMAVIARSLLEVAKKAGNDKDQLEYLTVIALSGRGTPDEYKDIDAVYRKTHNGSTDGMEAMLDARWRRDNVRFAVTPFTRPADVKPTGRVVLAEVFPGSG